MALVEMGGIGPSYISGKVGGHVWARNAGGIYVRSKTPPTNPNTSFQQVVRDAQKTLATRWVEVLTDGQRSAWDTYAKNVGLPNRLGRTTFIPANAMYVRCNVSRIQSGLAVIDDAPLIYDLGTFTPPAGTVGAEDTTMSLAFTNTDDWAAEAGSAMLVYCSRPQNNTINFFKGPYRYAGKIPGAATPPTSPATITLPFAAGAEGSKLMVKVRVSRVDGRLSSDFQVQLIAG